MGLATGRSTSINAEGTRGGRGLPRFVVDEVEAFLKCGILAHGFIRVACDTCREQCGRIRVQTPRLLSFAAHLRDHVMPHVPVRQWVLTVPVGLRFRMAFDPALAGISALNLNVHFHTLMMDGVYQIAPNGVAVFHAYPQWVKQTVRNIDISADPEVVVFLVDELGQPLANAPVELVLSVGTKENVTTDANGRIRPRVKPGLSFDIVINDVHEGGVGSSLATASGRHFEPGGDGPEETP